MISRNVYSIANGFANVTVPEGDTTVQALLQGIGRSIDNRIRLLSLESTGQVIIRVDYNQAAGANSYQLQYGNALSIRCCYQDALRIHVNTGVGNGTCAMNIEQEGE